MLITKIDLLSLRDGRTIRGTCQHQHFSITTPEWDQGFSKASISSIVFGQGTQSDLVELKSGRKHQGVLHKTHDRIYFTLEGEEDEQTFFRHEIERLEFQERADPDPAEQFADMSFFLTEDEFHGPECAVCGCTEEQACPGGCVWVDDGTMRDVCSRCAHPGGTRFRKRRARPFYGRPTRLIRKGLEHDHSGI
ncbi:MAG: hypothetical protein K1Y36_29395 [Blastocatellia bacterium]|nr:hypothetical protein [Blastocatellia bacterium]